LRIDVGAGNTRRGRAAEAKSLCFRKYREFATAASAITGRGANTARHREREARMTDLVLYDGARRALAEAHRVDEVKDIIDKAMAMQLYAKQAKDETLITQATEIRMRAERRAGELLIEMEERNEREMKGGDRRSKSQAATLIAPPPKLADLGVSKTQSSRWQRLAALKDERFEEELKQRSKRAYDGIARARVKAQSATKEKPAPAKSKGSVGSRDLALESFEAHVLELVRLTRNREPERFAKTAVAPSDIAKLSRFLFELSGFLGEPHGSEESAEATAEKRKAAYTAAEADAEARS
jgi:hypothetical protein